MLERAKKYIILLSKTHLAQKIFTHLASIPVRKQVINKKSISLLKLNSIMILKTYQIKPTLDFPKQPGRCKNATYNICPISNRQSISSTHLEQIQQPFHLNSLATCSNTISLISNFYMPTVWLKSQKQLSTTLTRNRTQRRGLNRFLSTTSAIGKNLLRPLGRHTRQPTKWLLSTSSYISTTYCHSPKTCLKFHSEMQFETTTLKCVFNLRPGLGSHSRILTIGKLITSKIVYYIPLDQSLQPPTNHQESTL